MTSAASTRSKPQRRTQQERREATRRALLDATVSCLTEAGYSATTPAMICERAGLSRSAHLHQFGSRAALVSAGIAHLGRQLADTLGRQLGELPTTKARTGHALDLLWEAFNTDLFRTALDLWAAARTDPELMAELRPVERHLDREAMQLCAGLFPDQAERHDFEQMMDFVLSTIRGLALLAIVHPSDGTTKERWAYARVQLLALLEGPADARRRRR